MSIRSVLMVISSGLKYFGEIYSTRYNKFVFLANYVMCFYFQAIKLLRAETKIHFILVKTKVTAGQLALGLNLNISNTVKNILFLLNTFDHLIVEAMKGVEIFFKYYEFVSLGGWF